ncbi:MAG: patatin-like phospholipase family protein [Leptonema sp. (in: Bacteria)]|nr:patatin-like phospholipase family protein [Leptonema sp. (in: bacteria)]
MKFAGYQIGQPVVGLALGSGAARGWAHIGVLHALETEGIFPTVVAGSSAGAVVAAFHAAHALDRLEDFVRNYTGFSKTIAHLDIGLGHGGMITGKRWLSNFLESYLPARDFKQLSMPLGVVAVDLISMREVQVTSGPLIPAIRSSVAVPGFFSPYQFDDMLLVDGGLLNPVPIDLTRSLGADIVIAVDLNSDSKESKTVPDSITSVIGRSFETMMQRVHQTNMQLMQPDITITPQLQTIGFLDYHKGKASILEGERAAYKMMPEIKRLLASPIRPVAPPLERDNVIHCEIGRW